MISNLVDLLIWAHIHNYGRSFPVFNYTYEHQPLDVYTDPKFPVHIITGQDSSQKIPLKKKIQVLLVIVKKWISTKRFLIFIQKYEKTIPGRRSNSVKTRSKLLSGIMMPKILRFSINSKLLKRQNLT